MSDETLGKSRLLDLYHRKIALSALPNGYDPYFQLGKVQWGYGLIDDSGQTTVLEDIPANFSAMDETFATGTATYTYINGKTVIVATLPRKEIPDGVVRRCSMMTILDNDNDAVGAVVFQPQNVTNKMDMSITLEIDHTDPAKPLTIRE